MDRRDVGHRDEATDCERPSTARSASHGGGGSAALTMRRNIERAHLLTSAARPPRGAMSFPPPTGACESDFGLPGADAPRRSSWAVRTLIRGTDRGRRTRCAHYSERRLEDIRHRLGGSGSASRPAAGVWACVLAPPGRALCRTPSRRAPRGEFLGRQLPTAPALGRWSALGGGRQCGLNVSLKHFYLTHI